MGLVSFGRRHRRPSAKLLKLARKYHVKVSIRKGGRRVYKSVAVLKKQIRAKMNRVRPRRVSRVRHVGKRTRFGDWWGNNDVVQTEPEANQAYKALCGDSSTLPSGVNKDIWLQYIRSKGKFCYDLADITAAELSHKKKVEARDAKEQKKTAAEQAKQQKLDETQLKAKKQEYKQFCGYDAPDGKISSNWNTSDGCCIPDGIITKFTDSLYIRKNNSDGQHQAFFDERIKKYNKLKQCEGKVPPEKIKSIITETTRTTADDLIEFFKDMNTYILNPGSKLELGNSQEYKNEINGYITEYKLTSNDIQKIISSLNSKRYIFGFKLDKRTYNKKSIITNYIKQRDSSFFSGWFGKKPATPPPTVQNNQAEQLVSGQNGGNNNGNPPQPSSNDVPSQRKPNKSAGVNKWKQAIEKTKENANYREQAIEAEAALKNRKEQATEKAKENANYREQAREAAALKNRKEQAAVAARQKQQEITKYWTNINNSGKNARSQTPKDDLNTTVIDNTRMTQEDRDILRRKIEYNENRNKTVINSETKPPLLQRNGTVARRPNVVASPPPSSGKNARSQTPKDDLNTTVIDNTRMTQEDRDILRRKIEYNENRNKTVINSETKPPLLQRNGTVARRPNVVASPPPSSGKNARSQTPPPPPKSGQSKTPAKKRSYI